MSRKTLAVELLGWVKLIGVAFAVALFINVFIFEMTGVDGASMNSTLEHGDRLFSIKINQIFKNIPNHGDIVIVDGNTKRIRNISDEIKDSAIVSSIMRSENRNLLIKRVIGKPNDILEIIDGRLYRNGEFIEEDYINEEMIMSDMKIEVPDNHIFVMGDNRNNSKDSRSREIGSIPLKNVRGKVIIRLFPFNKIQLF